ncbi:hypothetical protein KFE25_005084 [Diacronema lutheri]|uniref:Uncharacterized protein n=1 Tax=Diacronema lutheri TaxID=2081491 RepID=A0A8J5X7I4_DIALT|nr:hypothetical protein KFE25_005084 [Diacronema lutheri]
MEQLQEEQLQELFLEPCRVVVETREQVMELFRRLMHGPVADAFTRAERGELCSTLAPPFERIGALEAELRRVLLDFGIRPELISGWSLADTHFWELLSPARFESPVLATLNCAPGYCCASAALADADDHGATRSDMRPDGDCRWTQEYIPTIITALLERDAWPDGIVPLITDFRCVCPVLVAQSFGARGAALGQLGCGDFAEADTNSHNDRMLYGRFTRVLHESTRAWLRVAHARPAAALARAKYEPRALMLVAAARHARLAGEPSLDDDDDELARQLDEPFCATSPTGVNFVCIRAHHPGHDAYKHGCLLKANVAAWALAGALLAAFHADVSAAGELTAELAEQIVARARSERPAACALADELAPIVAQRMSSRGYARILLGGPYGELARRAGWSSSSSDS